MATQHIRSMLGSRPCRGLHCPTIAASHATTSGRFVAACAFKGGQCSQRQLGAMRKTTCASTIVQSSSGSAPIVPEDGSNNKNAWIFAAALLAAAAGSLCIPSVWVKVFGSETTHMAFLEGFSLIFMSELGDKTFFIAALLAMRVGKVVSFLGSTAALTVMTAISVSIGVACASVPAFVNSSIPVGEYLGAALLVFFGVKSIVAGLKMDPNVTGSELADAEEEMEQAETAGKKFGNFWQVAALIFVAEWGDRSMLATIALAIHNPPIAVGVGATLAHALATSIAVIGGSLASKYISERMVNLTGGALFLVFAVATVLGLA